MSSSLLSIGVSGLQANQAALTTTGHNITNANTEGYSRQRVLTEANNPQLKGAGYIGTGTHIETIERVANQFLIKQLRMDTAGFNSLDVYSDKISQLDNMIANSDSGLLPSLDDFFSSLQSASSDPTSLPARQLVLKQSESLSTRFNSIYAQFDDINRQINNEARNYTIEVNALAQGVADINQQLSATNTNSSIPVNDFLDQRDELIRKISELVQVNSIDQGNGTVDLFIGGQPLVLGVTASRLDVVPGETDPARSDIILRNSFTSFNLTDSGKQTLSGGKLGGLIDFRSAILDEAFNTVGQIALSVSEAFNEQQSSGLNLDGEYGHEIFSHINSTSAIYSRVAAGDNNAPPANQAVSVLIGDSGELTNSDYMLEFNSTAGSSTGNAYELIRLSDRAVVASGNLLSARPASINADGFSIQIESGSFSDGDTLRIQPTRFAAKDITVNALRPEALAFAAPVVVDTSLGNSGSGVTSAVEMLGINDPLSQLRLPLFSQEGALSPPLIVRFSSPTRYDVLDNSDPANPKSLQPPLNNQLYVPGLSNSILASEPGQTRMVSDGFNAGRVPNNVVTVPPGSQPANAYINETMRLTYTDSNSGLVNTYPAITIAAGSSAENIAQTLSLQPGLNAQASTYMELEINDDGGGQAMNIILNGIDLTAVAPPNPITPDYIANTINNDAALQIAGISAVSDGITLQVFSSTGVDFQVQVAGDATDTLAVKGNAGAELFSTMNMSAGVDFNSGAPTSFTLDLGAGPRTINLSGTFSDSQSVVDYLQSQINSAFNSPSKIAVNVAADGSLEFSTFDTSHNASLTIAGVTNDVLGLTSAAAAGSVSPNDIVSVSGAGGLPTVNALTVGGTVAVTLDDGFTLNSNVTGQGNVFSAALASGQNQAVNNYFGFNFNIDGFVNTGDEFAINFNSNGVSDNRNALQMLDLQQSTQIEGGLSFSDSYANLVAKVGSLTSQGLINRDASEAILEQSQGLRDSVSAVNLDEEAANLIRYEMAYTASSRVISVAQDIIDTLFAALR